MRTNCPKTKPNVLSLEMFLLHTQTTVFVCLCHCVCVSRWLDLSYRCALCTYYACTYSCVCAHLHGRPCRACVCARVFLCLPYCSHRHGAFLRHKKAKNLDKISRHASMSVCPYDRFSFIIGPLQQWATLCEVMYKSINCLHALPSLSLHRARRRLSSSALHCHTLNSSLCALIAPYSPCERPFCFLLLSHLVI